jgi:glycosyltransferase involved in cell wall biosynthesis
MNITFVLPSLGCGGAQRVASLLGSHWAAKGWGVTLLCLDASRRQSAFFPLHEGVHVQGLDLTAEARSWWRGAAANLRRLRALRAALAASRPDVILGLVGSTAVLSTLANLESRVPLVAAERNNPLRQPLPLPWRVLRRLTLPLASTVAVQTWESLESLPPGVLPRARVIPNPVVMGSEVPPVPDSRLICAVGRLHQQKGFDLLLRAFAAVARQFPDWRLRILGEGAERASLESLVRDLGLAERVELPGAVRDVRAEMSACEVFVLPSRSEGYPNALLEAMALGRAVLASDCPWGPGALIRHGENGLLAQGRGDAAMVASLARELAALLADPDLRHGLGRAAVTVRERHCLEAVAGRWERLFADLGALPRDNGRRGVLFVSPSMAGGGAERVVATLLRHLDRRRFAPSLALAKAAGPLLDDLPDDVDVIPLGRGRVRRCWPALVRLVRRQRPHVVCGVQGHMNLLVRLAMPLFPKGTRVLARESYILGRKLAAGEIPAWYTPLYAKLWPGFDAVLCQSSDMLQDLESRVPGARLVHLPNPVDVERLRGLAAPGQPRHDVLGPERPCLVAMGRLVRQKGFDLLLEALALAAREMRSRPRLTIIGQGPLEPELRGQTLALGLERDVRFAGFLANPFPLLAEADCFVLSSRYEGFPNALLEALALGVPALALACPGGVEEIVRPGKDGWLAPPEDVAALSALIREHGRPALDRQAIAASARERFGVEAVLPRFERLLCSFDTPEQNA